VAAEWLRPGDEPATPCGGHGPAVARRPPPFPAREAPPRIRIRWPEEGATFLADPEAPAGTTTIPFEAVADPPQAQLVWYVDGRPWRTVDHPYATRWALVPGTHVIQARPADVAGASAPVRIAVR
jgi:penicillin-binding protein 1C